MNLKENKPAILGIYLSKEQIGFIQNEKLSLDLIESFQKRIDDCFGNIKIFTNHPIPQILEHSHFMGDISEKDFLLLLSEKLPPSKIEDEDIDEVYFAYIKGIYPLLSKSLTSELMERHIKYLSQYSYSENLPPGIVPYFISREFVNSLQGSDNLDGHAFLLKNINNYDTEIFFKAPDLRQLRLDFTLGNARSIKLTSSLLIKSESLDYKDIYNLISENTEIFRSSPSYLEIEVYRGCEYDCIFCPRNIEIDKTEKKEISPDIYKKAIREFEETFQFPLTVCLGGLGEPLLHSSFLEFIDVALDYTYLEKIYIETALYPNIDKLLDYLGKLDESEKAKVQFIINISTLDLEKYKSLYNPKDIGLEEILKKIDKLISVLGKDSVYVQMIKMKEIESEIESYFNTWEEKGVKIILQKYNSFAKKLPERRVSDLTPIQRDFCWHLARDLYLNYDGKVSICKQDIKKELGDLNKESILEIWNRGKENFQNSFSGKHDLLPSPCLDCDEWYTFNA